MAFTVSLSDLTLNMPTWQLPDMEVRREDPSFSNASEMPKGYVWPPVSVTYTEAQTPVVIIRAPGAMGKSMAAEAIAAMVRAPLIDLSKMNVGSNSLSGMLLKVLGPANAAQYMLGLDKGQASIVLDGLDEAQLRAGKQHFWSFLEDVASLLDASERARQVVMLGRPDAALAAELVFQELGVLYEIVELQPLHREQAMTLVRNTLDMQKIDGQPYKVHRTYPAPFAELEALVFDDLAEALAPGANTAGDYWGSVAYFLGYPPVVQAVAKRLASPNPQAEIQTLRAAQPAPSRQSVERGRLLKNIVDDILDRESTKVRKRAGEALGFAQDDRRYNILYTREEQTLRILAYVSDVPLALELPAILSTTERTIYEELVDSFVPDHPLVVDRQFANAVFADYVRAFVTVADTAQLHGAGRVELLASTRAPGPFLVHFVSGMTLGDGVGYSVVDDSCIDDLIKSYIAGSDGSAYFILAQTKASYSLMIGLFPREIRNVRNFDTQALGFSLVNSSGVIELTSPISRGTIVLRENGIVLSAPHGDLELGPDVVIYSHDLEIRGASVTVSAGEDDGPVYLATPNFSGNASTQLSVNPPSALAVSWPDCWHPWRQYKAPFSDFPGDDEISNAKANLVLMGLRRILTSFKQGAGSDPSQYYEMLDRIVVGRNRIYGTVLARLIELGIIEREGDSYKLKLSKLGPYGFAYSDLRGPNFGPRLSALLRKVLESTDVLEALRSI